MKHERINYKDIMECGFTDDPQHDSVYEAQYGFPYSIVTLNLTKKIYLQWDKETGLCWIYRTDKDGWIQAKRPVLDLDNLKALVSFFLEKDTKPEAKDSSVDNRVHSFFNCA